MSWETHKFVLSNGQTGETTIKRDKFEKRLEEGVNILCWEKVEFP